MITEDQLEQLAIQWFQDTGWSYVNGKVISPEGEAAERECRGNIEHRMEENLELPKIGAGIAMGIKAAFFGWCRPFRARNSVGDGTQGAALGYRVPPRWGGRGRRRHTSLVQNKWATGKRFLQVRPEKTQIP